MSHWGFVDAPTGIYVDRVDDFRAGLRILVSVMLILVLAGGRQEKAAIRGEGKPPEE